MRATLLYTLSYFLSCWLGPAQAQDLSFFDRFIDEEDGYLDASEFLEDGGFIPLPILLTEPAVQGGLGLVAAFIGVPEEGSQDEPTITALGYIVTGNDSEIGFGAHSGNAFDGSLRYLAALGAGSVNLDFFLGDGEQPVSLNTEALFAHLEAQYRLGQSNFYFGPSATWVDTKISPNESGAPAGVSQDVTLAALGLSLHYDSRDNRFTPRNGINAVLSYERFDDNWGSDVDYDSFGAFAAWFHSPDDFWTFSAMADFRKVDDGAPFFVEPSINLRGVPFNRYQGDEVLSTELEIRRQLSPRWGLVGFGGYGMASSDDSDFFPNDNTATTFGAGIRYRVARKLGLDMGVDVARGPEDTTVHIQFGHAWSLRMD